MLAMLSGPLFSIMLTVLAGVALRYALWYGRDSDSRSQPDESESLRVRQRTLQDAVERSRAETLELKSQVVRLTGENNDLSRMRQVQQQEAAEQQRQLAAAQRQVEAFQCRLSELAQARESGAESGAGTAPQTVDLEMNAQQQAELAQALAAARQAEQQLLEMQAESEHRESRLTAIGEQRDRALQDLRELQAGWEQLRSQLDDECKQRAAAEQSVRQAEEHVALAQAELRFTEELRREQRELKQALQRSVQDAQRTQDELRARTEELQGAVARAGDACAQQESEIRALRTEKEEVLRGLHREQDRATRLQEQLEETLSQLNELRQLAEQLSSARSQAEQSAQRLQAANDELAGADAERTSLRKELLRARRQVDELTGSVQKFENQLAELDMHQRKLRAERESLSTQLERERAERNALERVLRAQSKSLERLRLESESLESLLERQAMTQQALQHHADRLRLGTSLDSDPPLPLASEVFSLKDFDTSRTGPCLDPVLGRVYLEAPAHQDDLTQLNNLDHERAARLHELGIYQLRQVAEWDAGAVSHLAERLGDVDAADLGEWVEQAAELVQPAERRAA